MDISGKFFCSRCMRQLEEEGICPFCGYDHREEENENPALCRGTLLHERYQLGSVIGIGGFGITYAAYDELLQTPVAVKEYYPRDYVRRDTDESDEIFVPEDNQAFYRIGKEHFIREARVLGMVRNLPGVVNVQDYFEENGTAYIVMEFIRGMTLGKYARRNPMKPEELLEKLKAPIDALSVLHRQGVLHRDITPFNLMVQEDGQIKLIDFGSAAQMKRQQSVIMVTERYAPLEQYETSGESLGPWTDIYSLCATIYEVLTGEPISPAMKRAQKDDLIPIQKRKLHLKSWQSRAIMEGLEIYVKKRPKSIEEFRAVLYNTPLPEEIRLRKKIRRQYTAVTAGILLAVGGGYWAVNYLPGSGGTLMNVQETDFADFNDYNGTGSDVGVFGNKKYNRNEIASVTVLDSLADAGKDAWDVSAEQNRSVLAWVVEDGNLYDLYLAAKGGVTAGESCAYTFAYFENAEEISLGSNFDTSDVTDMEGMFQECTNLVSLDSEGLDTSHAEKLSDMFHGCKQLEKLDVNGFDTSRVSDMSGMFMHCSSLEQLDVSGFQTAGVTDFSSLFSGCRSLATLDVSRFDTGSAKTISDMFNRCEALTELDVSGFDTRNVTEMDGMFEDCHNLKALELSSFDTRKTQDMSEMFSGCSGLTELDLRGFVTSALTDMSAMFSGCESLTELEIRNLDTSKVTTMSGLFKDCSGLVSLNLEGLKTFSVENMSSMFEGCSSLSRISLSGLDTGNVTTMLCMFKDCESLTELDVSGFDMSKVTNTCYMFNGCTNLKYLELFGNTLSLEDISHMFRECISLTELDLSGMDVSKVTEMEELFQDCSMLETITLDGWNTEKTVDMSSMFSGCSSLQTIPTERLNTKRVTDMSRMFQGCIGLSSLDLSSFCTERVTDMSNMFSGCSRLTSLDLNGFDTSNVTDMSWMFCDCSRLEEVDLSNFDTSLLTDSEYMFSGCSRLRKVDFSVFESSDIPSADGMFNRTRWEGLEFSEAADLKGTLMSVSDTDFVDYDFESPEEVPVFGNEARKRSEIRSITVLDNVETAGEDAWDISEMMDGSVLAWTEKNGELYDLYLAAEGRIKVNENSRLLFACFDQLQEIHLNGNLDFGKVSDMSAMFYNCRALKNLDLSGLNTENAVTLRAMFEMCESLELIDFSGMDTSAVTDMGYLFNGCTSLKEVDVTGFKTDKVTDMAAMFQNCLSLEKVDVGGFNTERVLNMSWMFYNCGQLKELDISGFSLENVQNFTDMTSGCPALENLSGETYAQ